MKMLSNCNADILKQTNNLKLRGNPHPLLVHMYPFPRKLNFFISIAHNPPL